MQKKRKYKGVNYDKTCKLWRCKRERERERDTLQKKSVAFSNSMTHTVGCLNNIKINIRGIMYCVGLT